MDDEEIEWNETAVDGTADETAVMDVEREAEDVREYKAQEITLPSQEDIIEELSPILKRRRSEEDVASEVTWIPEIDKLFLMLQIGMSFITDYEFVEKEATPMDRAIKLFQSASNFLEYRDFIQRMINSIESSNIVKQTRHYRKAIRNVIDKWNMESGSLSTKYMTLKNRIPATLRDKVAENIAESKLEVNDRIGVIYNYLSRDKDIPLHQLVDCFQKYINKQTQDISTTTIQTIQNISDLASTMELDTNQNVVDTSEKVVVTSEDLSIISSERLATIQSSFYTANTEEEYEYPRMVPTGIANTGNSCYINVILQTLWRIKVRFLSFLNLLSDVSTW